jgi:uncharacterized protein
MTTVYIDTSILVAAFSSEAQQSAAMALLQDARWSQVLVSDWAVAEFTCAVQAKVLRGETPPATAHTLHQTLKRLMTQGALSRIAVLREDYSAVQHDASTMPCLVRGADALHLAVAARNKVSCFASLDKTQRIAARHWLPDVRCEPQEASVA